MTKTTLWRILTHPCYSFAIFCLVLVFLLSACSNMKTAFSPKRQAQLPLIATEQVNPDMAGKPSPLVVLVYELRSVEEFNNQDFFSLYANAKAILGANLLDSQRVVLTPGMKHTLVWTLQADTHYLGILAIYRNLDNTTWKQALPVNKGRLAGNSQVVFGSQGIQVKG